MGRKKGTKITDNPKDKILRVRIDRDTDEKLATICNAKQKNKSDIVRIGIDIQYDEIEKK